MQFLGLDLDSLKLGLPKPVTNRDHKGKKKKKKEEEEKLYQSQNYGRHLSGSTLLATEQTVRQWPTKHPSEGETAAVNTKGLETHKLSTHPKDTLPPVTKLGLKS